MHVGHLRSAIIGDSLANLYLEKGHNIKRINHIGDIGLHFGLIIAFIKENNLDDFSDINNIYSEAKKKFDTNEEFKNKSYEILIKLQKNTSDDINSIWENLCNTSLTEQNKIYDLLSINGLINIGESFYYKFIDELINELKNKNLLIKEDGRHIIKFDNMEKITIIKSDGGYTYDTTDLAAIKYRLSIVDQIFYVVDNGQDLHFKQIFEVAKLAGWLKENKKIFHVNFGIVKGADKKRLRTRNGDTPQLLDLLNEAISETKDIYIKNNSEINETNIKNLAIGSIKYADLLNNRQGDYVFSIKKLLDFKGKTLTYVMYSYVRISTIFNKLDFIKLENGEYDCKTDEKELIDEDFDIINILFKFPYIIDTCINTNMVHHICIFLYELSELISKNYKKLKCLFFDKEMKNIVSVNKSRINIFSLIKKIYLICFRILGIHEIEKI